VTDAVEIAREAARTGTAEAALVSITSHESLRQFRERAILAGAVARTALGMSGTEVARYSIGAAIDAAASNKRGGLPGFEGEIHEELVRRHGDPNKEHAILLPLDAVANRIAFGRRDLAATNGSTGSVLVDERIVGFVELARPLSTVVEFGASVVEGLTSNVTLACAAIGATVAGRTETASTTESTPTFRQVNLTPKRLSGYIEVSRQWLRQSSASAQSFLAGELMRTLADRIDQQCIAGTGGAGEFLGIANTPGIGVVTGTSLALAGCLELQTDCGNRLGPTGGYMTTRTVAALLAARQKATGTSTFLWEGNLYRGSVCGYPAASNANIAASSMLFGAWEQVVIASWGTMEIQVDPFTGFQSGTVGMHVSLHCDMAVRDFSAFSQAGSIT
jgi:HK97 family phage major capsid protein